MKHLRRFNEKLETDNYRSIFDDIDNDIMEMSEDEALEYLDEIINYCINKVKELKGDDKKMNEETKIKTDLEIDMNTEEAKENFKNEVNGYYAISTPKGKDSPETVLAYGGVAYLKQVLSYLNKTGVGNESDLYLAKIKYSKKDMDNVLSFIKYY